MTLSIVGAASLIALDGEGPIRGRAASQVSVDHAVGVAVEEGRIAEVGRVAGGSTTFDAAGCTVVPGFVDPHTHLPFYGWRADEDGARLAGIRYGSIHAEGGGIYRSQRLLAEASDDDVISFCRDITGSMLRKGTTTFETKSGYGLTVEDELRQLRLAKRLASEVPQDVVTTFLAAHAVPEGYTQGAWIGEITKAFDAAAGEALCEAVDIYVETIAFGLEHAARLSEEAGSRGWAMRVHADQLENGQTASMAARWGFRSADHLNHSSLDAVDDLAASDTAAVLLPGATFTLRQSKKPPARDLLAADAIVALGTDFNPGTSPIHSMPLVVALACRVYGLQPMEALVGATVNAAYVLGRDDRVGRLRPGHAADIVILDADGFEHVAYRPDADLVLAVLKDGEFVYLAPGAEDRFKG